MWQIMLLNFALGVIEKYILSSDSSKDDKILEVVKKGAGYLAQKDNNTVPYELGSQISEAVMKKK